MADKNTGTDKSAGEFLLGSSLVYMFTILFLILGELSPVMALIPVGLCVGCSILIVWWIHANSEIIIKEIHE